MLFTVLINTGLAGLVEEGMAKLIVTQLHELVVF